MNEFLSPLSLHSGSIHLSTKWCLAHMQCYGGVEPWVINNLRDVDILFWTFDFLCFDISGDFYLLLLVMVMIIFVTMDELEVMAMTLHNSS